VNRDAILLCPRILYCALYCTVLSLIQINLAILHRRDVRKGVDSGSRPALYSASLIQERFGENQSIRHCAMEILDYRLIAMDETHCQPRSVLIKRGIRLHAVTY